MGTIKSYTDLEQSKKLAKILPHKSADMCYLSDESLFPKVNYNGMVFFNSKEEKPSTIIPCWSLAALLEQLDEEITDNNGNDYTLTILKEALQYQLYYHDSLGRKEGIETYYYDNMVDACYEMIIKLHELNLL